MSAHQEVERLLDQIRAISVDPAVERAADKISILCEAYMGKEGVSPPPRVHLNRRELRVWQHLVSRVGKTVKPESLLSSLAFDEADGSDIGMKNVSVHVCRIRQKLAAANADYWIETDWGCGYRLRNERLPQNRPRGPKGFAVYRSPETVFMPRALSKAA
jgi:DNA-binding response OmpR family regulator